MTEMIERVAKVIASEAVEQNRMLELDDNGLGFYDSYDNKMYDCVSMARKSLAALRVPTDEMLAAGHKALIDGATSSLELPQVRAAVFAAMIDAALAE